MTRKHLQLSQNLSGARLVSCDPFRVRREATLPSRQRDLAVRQSRRLAVSIEAAISIAGTSPVSRTKVSDTDYFRVNRELGQ